VKKKKEGIASIQVYIAKGHEAPGS